MYGLQLKGKIVTCMLLVILYLPKKYLIDFNWIIFPIKEL